ncbi:cell division protein FtsQ/DivIB [Arthrobacter sp. UM1]|uniref:cell division protein FtsQ/DivIB n=1 Tax=Arthrobacter sp. UM1 TaxID=2766776 RepID=UPI001CF6ED56|nr:FtsQ-type POTRA domain-containing protein [Arthrobacter sp. UM1]MCB4207700.1 FtsQ-type POTRA domain-containing protein [Arthrobacter sp. UM1]
MARIPRLPSEDGPAAEEPTADRPRAQRPDDDGPHADRPRAERAGAEPAEESRRDGRPADENREDRNRPDDDGPQAVRPDRVRPDADRSYGSGRDRARPEADAAEGVVSARRPRPDAAPEPSGAHADVVSLDRRRRPRWGRRVLLTAVVAVLLSLAAVLAANVTPWMRVDEVQVSGNKFVSSDAIRSAVKEAEGRPLPQVDVQGLERRLEAIPGIDKAQISGRPPHGLMVTVNERSPVAQVQRRGGTDLIDSSGRTITTVQDASKYKLPIISESTSKNPSVFRALTTALSNVPDSILQDMREARAFSRDSVELLMNSGLRIVWGDESRPAQKAAVLEAVLKGVKGAKPDPTTGAVPAQPTLVDVSVPERPVTR